MSARIKATRKAKASARRSSETAKATASEGQRLQKVLAAAGVGSRRQCEQLIEDGRVEVDRRIVTELGTRVDPVGQEIRVDGQALRRPRLAYFLVNKPPGVISTSRDPAGRMRVIDLLGVDQRLFTVGRLDKSSEGLILVTNDGELAHRLLHPSFQVERTYHVVVAGEPSRESIDQLRSGIHLAEGRVQVVRLRVKKRWKRSTLLEMVLAEGRNREIRRMAARIGHKVMSLKRIAFGPLRLGELPSGAYRPLSRSELRKLRDWVDTPDESGSSLKQPKAGRGKTASRSRAGRPTRKKSRETELTARRRRSDRPRRKR
jgi:23S rRNA pseudouridine2605 synthase